MTKKNVSVCDLCNEVVANSVCSCCKRDCCKNCAGTMTVNLHMLSTEKEKPEDRILRSALNYQSAPQRGLFNPFGKIKTSPQNFEVTQRVSIMQDLMSFPLCKDCHEKISKCKKKDVDPATQQQLADVLSKSFKDLMFLNEL